MLESSSPPAPVQPRPQGILSKFMGIGFIALPLVLAMLALYGLLQDRRSHRTSAASNIQESWGGPEALVGPYLVVPLKPSTSSSARPPYAILAATDAAYVAQTKCEKRYRGIHNTLVYKADITANINWDPVLETQGQLVEADWERAVWVFTVLNPRSLLSRPTATTAGVSLQVSTASGVLGVPNGFQVPAILQPDGSASLELALSVKGSEYLSIRPGALQSRIEMKGDWPHPSFGGPWLPTEREVHPDNYYAQWILHEFSLGQVPLMHSADSGSIAGALQSAKGPELAFIQPVDPYRLIERAIKYASLVVALVFSVFLLYDLRHQLELHPIQYLFVGATVGIFLLLFLALGEIYPVWVAYTVAAALSTVMVSGYAKSVLAAGHRAWSMGGLQIMVYASLFVVLRLESYALIAGALVLTLVLAALMWFTRDFDWNRAGSSRRILKEAQA